MNLIQGIARGLVGRLTAGVMRADAGGQPPFAALLAERLNSRDTQAVESLAKRLLDLPVTSDEARGIAAELWKLVEDLKAAPGGAEAKISDFVSRVSRQLMLSPADTARLQSVADSYAERQLLTGLPV